MQSMILKQLDMPKQALNAIEKAQGHASGDLDSIWIQLSFSLVKVGYSFVLISWILRNIT